jgi:3-phenylpropionate/cinnamic acid dioxygenase small subunit
MSVHDRLAAHEFVSRYWFLYDEGRLDALADLLADDCHLRSRTETGQHPFEEFIASDSRGRDVAMAWTREHRRQSPYPLRHHAANVHVIAERDDELDISSYLFVTQIADRSPVALSSGIVHWTLRRTEGGYRLASQEVVLDSIESRAFHEVEQVADRQLTWTT